MFSINNLERISENCFSNLKMKISKQPPMFWDFLTYRRRSALWTPWIRGRERSDQLRANKRGFFKIAPHILENHRLLLRSCFLNTVNQRSWKHRVALITIRKNFLKQLLMFWKIQAYFEELMIEHRESEVVKTSGSSDDNKKEFFETASHVLKNSGLFRGADGWTPFTHF